MSQIETEHRHTHDLNEHYDSLSLDWRVCQLMLLVNAVWDLVSCVSIWQSFCVKDVQSLMTSANDTTSTTNENERAQPNESQVPELQNNTASGSIPLLNFIRGDNDSKIKIRELGWRNAACLSIAEMHTSMWVRKGDSFNHAACMLMAWWVLTLGIIRLYAAMNRDYIVLAVYSYALEGMFFLTEAFKSTMNPKKSCYTSIFCFLCMLLCVIKIPR